MPPNGNTPDANLSSVYPTDANAATVHRVNRCKRIYITASLLNAVTVYVRVGGSAPSAGDYTDYPLVAGASIPLDAEGEWLDLTKVYVIASASAAVHWIIGGSGIGGDVATTINLTGSFSFTETTLTDGDTTPDVTGFSFVEINNTNPTTITEFTETSGQKKILYTHMTDDQKTTFGNDPTKLKFLDLPEGVDWGPANFDEILKWYHDGTKWIFMGSTAAGA